MGQLHFLKIGTWENRWIPIKIHLTKIGPSASHTRTELVHAQEWQSESADACRYIFGMTENLPHRVNWPRIERTEPQAFFIIFIFFSIVENCFSNSKSVGH